MTLWSNLTGTPVLGRLAATTAELEILPMTLTTWGAWRAAHPETTVMVLDRDYGARWNFRYLPDEANRARRGVSFPIWKKSSLLERGAEVYALRRGEHARAWLIEALARRPVLNDRIGKEEIVLIHDPESGEVRIYERDGQRFRRLVGSGGLVDEAGIEWRREEDALVSEGGDRLLRLPGHLSLWFAWYGFFPHTTVWPEAPSVSR